MPNNVETRMWLVSLDRKPLSEKQVEGFFSQFISMNPGAQEWEDPREFDFNFLVPQPQNIWTGSVGGDENENLKNIEELGGLEAVKQALKERKPIPIEKSPCLTDKQIKQFGLVNGLDWNRKHWETKWGAYDCHFDWGASYGNGDAANVSFYTAWSVPEKILRMFRGIALKQGFDIVCEFDGELDYPGEYFAGKFMYWNGEWNNETEELERIGDLIDIHS